ncbi:MAG: ABC transporter permease subunit, partial [Gammaproteobacteria bacterium]|nr:ABC transporter permease subunit [Gammaproteobacteria bacterium]
VIVIAPVLVLVFAVQLGWVPAGWSGGRDVARWILPVIALALPQIAFIARITRSSMIDVLESEFIRTARAQGLQTATIIRHHAMKPALLPLLSYLGPAVVGLITGAIVVEKIFGIPGLGYLFVQGAQNRDFTLILGLVILYGTLIVVFNLAVDLLYGVLDPRIRRR